MPDELDQKVRAALLENFQTVEPTRTRELLEGSIRYLAKWRGALIGKTFTQETGTIVLNGPLKGLDFVEFSTEGCHVAKLLGSYEQPLHPYIEQAINTEYDRILNVGCAEGYYAVGLALRMPNTKNLAFDTNPIAQEKCKQLAVKNGVEDRIETGALFSPEDFANYSSGRTLVFCDIEGAELDLLNPDIAPALKQMDIIVEAHDCLIPGAADELTKRFAPSHNIERVHDNGLRNLDITPSWFDSLAHLDQILATWEWRSGPTPWLVMTAK